MRTQSYPSDVTDAQWSLIDPHLPVYPGGRPRTTDLRAVVDAVFYILRTGCQWRYLPKDFPPKSTVWRYFDEWRHNGTPDTIHELLRPQQRAQEAHRPPLPPTCSAPRCAPRRSPTRPGPPPAWTASPSIPPPVASSGAATTPRTSMVANAISSGTAGGCCWPCW